MFRGERDALCRFCRFAFPPDVKDCWLPVDRKTKHPAREEEKKAAAKKKVKDRAAVKANKDRAKSKIQAIAAKAERETNRETIRATRNSGRTNQDGDAIFQNRIVFDTKKQTQSIHPVVRLDELDKVRRQAKENKYDAGALVLVNAGGRKVVVFALEDVGIFVKEPSEY